MCILVGCITNHILAKMCILECTFGDDICIFILVAMHTFWRRCAFGETQLHLHFSCNAHILDDVHAFGGSHLHLHFGCNTHLFWRRCKLKYNCTNEITLFKHYCNHYHISSIIEENKTNFAS